MQPTLDGEVADAQPAEPEEPTPHERAFGIARAWIAYRASQNTPVVGRSPLHQLKSLIKPFLEAGYTDDEIKWGLTGANEGIPSKAQLDRALVDVRGRGRARRPSGSRGRAPAGSLQVNDAWEAGAVPVGATVGGERW